MTDYEKQSLALLSAILEANMIQSLASLRGMDPEVQKAFLTFQERATKILSNVNSAIEKTSA